MKTLSIIVSLWLIIQCNAIETPNYTVVNKLDDNIEIRKYAPSKWVCTSTESSATSMFYQLFNYISGQNDQNQKIPMTAPVVSYYDATNRQKTQCFFIPISFQTNTPKPTGTVYVEDHSELTIAVITFKGKATYTDYMLHKAKLIQTLGAELIHFDAFSTLTAGYDAPNTPVEGKTNEVFLRKID